MTTTPHSSKGSISIAILRFALVLGLLLFITWLDLVTERQVSLTLFYVVPIVLAARLCDNKTVVLIGGLAGVLWSWGDIVRGNEHFNPSIAAWNIGIRFSFFFLVGAAAILTKERHRASNARLSLMERTRELEKQIIEVSEHEQQRIGRDLHDGLCQFLAAIGCLTSTLKMDLEEEGLEKLTATAADIERLLAEAVKQARDLSHGLVPVQLDEGGLTAALQELASSTNRLFPLACSFEFAGAASALTNGKATHLYRIAQEAISNASKHGKAQNIDIRLSANRNVTNLSVADDGIGLLKSKRPAIGLGISIMRYRANLLGGELDVESQREGGTIVSCVIPTNPVEA